MNLLLGHHRTLDIGAGGLELVHNCVDTLGVRILKDQVTHQRLKQTQFYS